MYDMYPEWGPAKHREDDDRTRSRRRTGATAADRRDEPRERPEDN